MIKRKKIENKLTNEKTGIRKGYRQTSKKRMSVDDSKRAQLLEPKFEANEFKDLQNYYKDLIAGPGPGSLIAAGKGASTLRKLLKKKGK
jgi:hypothetical protein|tara:strand:+ start:2429 stop:2695 length:267 start_codon:yes stop_codon:yes gene_type:complete